MNKRIRAKHHKLNCYWWEESNSPRFQYRGIPRKDLFIEVARRTSYPKRVRLIHKIQTRDTGYWQLTSWSTVVPDEAVGGSNNDKETDCI